MKRGTRWMAMVVGSLVICNGMAQEEPPRDEVLSPQPEPQPQRLGMLALGEGRRPVSFGTEFNPAISLIADFTYARFTEELEPPPGFGRGGHGHDNGHGLEEGFRLREVELTLSGTVDPYFDAFATFGFGPDHVEIEEAYITTRMLPAGFQVKAGKFLSDVGYINKQHIHNWHFVDQPWMREHLFGEDGLNEVGVQVSWLPPTETYLRLGVEVLQGASEGVANYIGSGDYQIVTMLPDGEVPERNRWRADTGLKERDVPRLFTGFAKAAPDLGPYHAVQVGASGGYSSVMQMEEVHSSGRLETWDGDAWFAGVDAVYKYDGQGVMGHKNFVLQAEYLYRRMDLSYQSRQFENFSSLVTTDANDQAWKQDGLYVQGVYGFAPRWNAGLRTDLLGITNDGFTGRGTPESFGTSARYSGQLSYAPTEFSRLRAQVSYVDQAHDDDDDHGHQEAWMFLLQYNVSLGAHGAHAF